MHANDNVIPLSQLRMADVARVGGKNASLGELIGNLSAAGVRVPDGFATTADAYRQFLADNHLAEFIAQTTAKLDVEDTKALAAAGAAIRERIMQSPLPPQLEADIRHNYRAMHNSKDTDGPAVAVRSSATAEDMPDASFAGQQETFLNIRGEDAVIDAVRRVFASLFTDRAVSYRRHAGYDTPEVALSAGIQLMVRSDIAASGVMFTLDTESGFEDAVLITAAYGLGESIVQGAVNPDEFYVYKPALATEQRNPIIRRRLGNKAEQMILGDASTPDKSVKTTAVAPEMQNQFCINDDEVRQLAIAAVRIQKHYGKHMDIEWAKDGETGDIYIVQARPETVKSRDSKVGLSRYRIISKGEQLAEGRAIGQKIGVGTAHPIANASEMHTFQSGEVLVADMTDPDWEPVMKRAAAIVTRRGGRTCHAAIIARELGVPAIVGCGDDIRAIDKGKTISVCCAEGDSGRVYDGAMEFEIDEITADTNTDSLSVKLQVNVANPDLAFEFARLPCDGVGLARLEFIIARTIGFHPRCALSPEKLSPAQQKEVARLSAGYASPRECYVGKIAEGTAAIAAAFAPRPVVLRLSDFKSNEYAGLCGGDQFEPHEENPMIGFRGAARYRDPIFRDCFALECEALLRTRTDMGINNLWLMVPFVRTPEEGAAVVEMMSEMGLRRGDGKDDWKIIMMCEVPSNALLADEFLQHFDGFSIGSNDLTQLVLALDRDSELVANIFDERNAAVKALISRAISACRNQNKYVGICGQAPSDHPDFAEFLVQEGISAISLNPDTLLETRMKLAKKFAK